MKIFNDAQVTLELLRRTTVANFGDSKQDCVQFLNMRDNWNQQVLDSCHDEY